MKKEKKEEKKERNIFIKFWFGIVYFNLVCKYEEILLFFVFSWWVLGRGSLFKNLFKSLEGNFFIVKFI